MILFFSSTHVHAAATVTSASENLRLLQRTGSGSVGHHPDGLPASNTFYNLGPTCKKAVNFGDNHVFKSSIFEPTPETIRNADLAEERVKARDAQNRRAMSSPALPTAANMDIVELTDSSDDDLPEFKELLQQSSSKKSSSSRGRVKRLESMKLEDDGFEMMGSPSPPPSSFLSFPFLSLVG